MMNFGWVVLDELLIFQLLLTSHWGQTCFFSYWAVHLPYRNQHVGSLLLYLITCVRRVLIPLSWTLYFSLPICCWKTSPIFTLFDFFFAASRSLYPPEFGVSLRYKTSDILWSVRNTTWALFFYLGLLTNIIYAKSPFPSVELLQREPVILLEYLETGENGVLGSFTEAEKRH